MIESRWVRRGLLVHYVVTHILTLQDDFFKYTMSQYANEACSATGCAARCRICVEDLDLGRGPDGAHLRLACRRLRQNRFPSHFQSMFLHNQFRRFGVEPVAQVISSERIWVQFKTKDDCMASIVQQKECHFSMESRCCRGESCSSGRFRYVRCASRASILIYFWKVAMDDLMFAYYFLAILSVQPNQKHRIFTAGCTW